MLYEKFGKSFKDIADLKTSFFQDNENHLQRSLRYANLYIKQPKREYCKICETVLSNGISFIKHGIPYAVCVRCGQLNGLHQDTDAFCEAVYTSQNGKEYAENYAEGDAKAYIHRRDAIYRPKAEFLLDILRRAGEQPEKMSFADMGAGAGYFVSAMEDLGIRNINGYEVGKTQVDLGNWMMPSSPLKLIQLHETIHVVESLSCEVMSFVGVFEHLQDPRGVLSAMKKNPNVKYFYFCVPMFSPCIYNEMAFPGIMPRQLTVGHTHLFTKSSIEYLEQEFSLKRLGAWWFGTDMMDYYRSIQVTLANNKDMEQMAFAWTELFEVVLDDMQLAIDRHRESSQVHMVMRVRD